MRIDAHQHFWRIDRGDYAWLSQGQFPNLYRDFLPQDLAPLLRQGGIDRTVLIQAAESVAETEFLLSIADSTPFVAGVVGWVDFTGPGAPDTIARLAQHSRLKGLRSMLQDLPDDDYIMRADLEPALRAMTEHALRFDALIKPPQLPAIRRFLDRYPDLPVVIDHGAKPKIAANGLDEWAAHIRAIARDSHAVCKLSGIATEAAPGWRRQTLQPYVDVLLEAFGPNRLMFGSDWPVLTENGDYLGWLAAAEDLTSDLSEPDKAQVFGGVATRFYGLQI